MLTTEGRHSRPTPLSLHVLVVDDEFLIRWSLAETLGEEGHRVAEAGDGETALKALGSEAPFDIVLLDYHLPDSHDLTLLATIRQLAPQAVVIMMTAFGTPEMIEHALGLGAFRVVSKPFDVHDIASLVLQAHGSRPADAPH
jgi:DNA-binding NtrC family response regulator